MKSRQRIVRALTALVVLCAAGLAWWHLAVKPPLPTGSQKRMAAANHHPEKEKSASPAVAPPTAQAVPLRFNPSHGQALTYRFESRSAGELDLDLLSARIMGGSSGKPAATRKEPVTLHSNGDIQLKFYQADNRVWNVAGRIDNLVLKINDLEPAYARAVVKPFAFRMTAVGILSNFQFVEALPTDAEKFVRGLLAAMQTICPQNPKSEWRTREIDSLGVYRARYRITRTEPTGKAVHLTKEKMQYLSLSAGGAGGLREMKTRVADARQAITLYRGTGWLHAVDSREHLISSVGGQVWSDSKSHLTVQRVDTGNPRFPATFADFLAKIEESSYLREKYYLTDTQLNRLGDGLNIDAALLKYIDLLNADIPNARSVAEKFFVNYLRLYPRAVFDLVTILDGDPLRTRFDHETQLTLWRLITAAGHNEAQQAVIAAATDEKFSDLTHIRALAYIHDFEYPDPLLLDQLQGLYNQIEPDATDEIDAQRRVMSLYAIGGLGSAEKLNEDLKPEVGQLLTSALATASGPEETIAILAALGNYGGSETVDDITPYLEAFRPEVRAGAYDALRNMETPEAVVLLTQNFQTETNTAVRVQALRTLTSMPVSEEGVTWARSEVLAASHQKEQEALVKLLGETLPDYPENEAALRSLLKENPSNRIKRAIYQYVAPE